MNGRLAIVACTLVGSATAGCSSQVGPDYQGEVLATVSGLVQNKQPNPASEAQAVLVWVNSAGSPDRAYAEQAEVTGGFPASFELSIFEPPPLWALNDATDGGRYPEESRFGVAFIGAVKADTDFDNPQEGDGLGVAENHVLVYVESDVQPGTYSEEFLHGTLSAGFHIMDVVRVPPEVRRDVYGCETSTGASGETYESCDEVPFDELYLAQEDMDTEVPIRMAEDLDEPNWT